MAKVNVSTTVTATSLSPLMRVLRTVLQTVIAYGTSFPVLIGWLHLTGAQSAEYGSIVSGIVFVASAIQNVLEHFGLIPTLFAKPAGSVPVTK